ncbi:cytochrome c3 family protein [Deferribacter abyssi]|uniref:cytochrome c3 family protein n=1 Tax=Deferribacter abyssi TaxID=213806 RepID=UPI003C26DA5F
MKKLIMLYLVFFSTVCFGFEKDITDNGLSINNCVSCHSNTIISIFCDKNIKCVDCHSGKSKKLGFLGEDYINRFILEKKDPHNSKYLCLVCHESKGSENSINLKFDGDDVALCEQCHNEATVGIEAHSVNFTYKPSDEVRIPDNFPLKDGKVTCMTCHVFDCLTGNHNDKYLRGEYIRREKFCYNCHNATHFKKYNPHKQVNENGDLIVESCVICHKKQPDISKDRGIESVVLKGDINELCNGCHQIKGVHPTGINHLRVPNEDIKKRIKRFLRKEKIYVPFGENFKILCVTCHLPHQYEMLKNQATGKYAKRTRFNSGYELCIMCHLKD